MFCCEVQPEFLISYLDTCFPLSVLRQQLFIIIFILVLLLSGHSEDVWEPLEEKQCPFGCLGALDRKVLSLFLCINSGSSCLFSHTCLSYVSIFFDDGADCEIECTCLFRHTKHRPNNNRYIAVP